MRTVDAELWTTTYATSAKVPVLAAAGTAACLLFDGEDDPFPYEVIAGRIKLDVPDDNLIGRWLGTMAGEAHGERGARNLARLRTGKRLFIRVAVEEIMSFDA